jgi:Uma2 family endonuclease
LPPAAPPCDHAAEEAAMSTAERLQLTEREYLELERAADEKHEYVNGEAVAMAGASLRHNIITANISGNLWMQLRGKPCRPLSNDQRVHVPDTGLYTYPDVVVLCGPPKLHPQDDHTLLNPRVVFEVLSDSTELHDRTAKFAHYRRIEGFEEYVLVSQKERRVEHYRRVDGGQWLFTDYAGEGAVVLPALGVELPLDEIYAGVEDAPAEAG